MTPISSGRDSTPSCVCIAVAAGLALGALTAYAQGFLPRELDALANSAAPWALAAGALAVIPRRVVVAVAVAVLSMIAMLIGYVVANHERGYASGSALLLFWGLAAVVVGPVLGVAAVWLRTERSQKAAMAGAAVAGLLVGEGLYGLTVISDSTYGPYWVVELSLGVLVVIAVSMLRLRTPAAVALCVTLTAVAAALFRVVYAAGGISAFG